jgi:hypothetical protein
MALTLPSGCARHTISEMFGVKINVRFTGCSLNHVANERKENHKMQEEKGRRQVKALGRPLARSSTVTPSRRGGEKLRDSSCIAVATGQRHPCLL